MSITLVKVSKFSSIPHFFLLNTRCTLRSLSGSPYYVDHLTVEGFRKSTEFRHERFHTRYLVDTVLVDLKNNFTYKTPGYSLINLVYETRIPDL